MNGMNGQEQPGRVTEYVTVTIGEQLFGLPISRVQDVFVPGKLTQVPLASDDIAGVLNLRGRIVTAIDMRRRLGMPERDLSPQDYDRIEELIDFAAVGKAIGEQRGAVVETRTAPKLTPAQERDAKRYPSLFPQQQ
jgi:chemotaxis signal transduction protein